MVLGTQLYTVQLIISTFSLGLWCWGHGCTLCTRAVALGTRLYSLLALKVRASWHNREPGEEGRWPLTGCEEEWALACYPREYRTTVANVENSLRCHRMLRTVPREGRGLSVWCAPDEGGKATTLMSYEVLCWIH